MKNINSSFNKEKFIKYAIKVNIYHQGYRKRTEIDVIGSQKQNVILRILQLAYYSFEIDWKKREVKITRYKIKEERKEEEKIEKKKNNRNEESSRRTGDLRQRGESSKV